MATAGPGSSSPLGALETTESRATMGWNTLVKAWKSPGSAYLAARDWAWRLAPAHAPVQRTWNLDPARLQTLRILWPSSYPWEQTHAWVENLREGFRSLVHLEPIDLPQPYSGTLLIRVLDASETVTVAIDYSDYLDQIHRDGVEDSLCYFKMQYQKPGYGDDRIVPGGYTTFSPNIYHQLRALRRIKDRSRPLFDVYGRFGLRYATEIRQKAIAAFNQQSDFQYEGGQGTIRHTQSLREVARAKICIDLPSNSDFTFRLVDYLAVGACVIGPPHRTTLHVPLVDREHLIHCAPDLSDLVPLCKQYLDDTAERERITRNARDYFDRYLHRNQLASYYLSTIIHKLHARRGGSATAVQGPRRAAMVLNRTRGVPPFPARPRSRPATRKPGRNGAGGWIARPFAVAGRPGSGWLRSVTAGSLNALAVAVAESGNGSEPFDRDWHGVRSIF